MYGIKHMNCETLGWIVFALGSILFSIFCWYVINNVKTAPHRDFVLRSCICGRKAPSIKMARGGYGFGAGFMMFYLLAVIFPALFIGDPKEGGGEIPWYGWAFLVFYLSLGLVPLIKYTIRSHSPMCAIRRCVLGLVGFSH